MNSTSQPRESNNHKEMCLRVFLYVQLVARLERMERRLSIMQKRSKDKEPPDVPNSLPPSTTRARPSRADSITASEQRSQSRSSSIDRGKSRSRPTSHSGTPVPPEDKDAGGSSAPAKRSHKRRLKLDLDSAQEAAGSRKTKKKTVERTEVRTALEYCGLDLPHDMDVSDSVDSVGVVCNHSKGLPGQNDFLITGIYAFVWYWYFSLVRVKER